MAIIGSSSFRKDFMSYPNSNKRRLASFDELTALIQADRLEISGEATVPFPADIYLSVEENGIKYQEKTPYHESIIWLDSEFETIYRNGNEMPKDFIAEFQVQLGDVLNNLPRNPKLKVSQRKDKEKRFQDTTQEKCRLRTPNV